MSELLNSGRVGEIGIKHLKEQRKRIVETWEKSGLLEGLDSNPPKQNIAQLLEGQASAMINEVKKPSHDKWHLDKF